MNKFNENPKAFVSFFHNCYKFLSHIHPATRTQ